MTDTFPELVPPAPAATDAPLLRARDRLARAVARLEQAAAAAGMDEEARALRERHEIVAARLDATMLRLGALLEE